MEKFPEICALRRSQQDFRGMQEYLVEGVSDIDLHKRGQTRLASESHMV